MPNIGIKIVVGGGVALVLIGVALAIWGDSGNWAAFCILLGISIILLSIGQKVTLYLGICFLVGSLVFLGFGLAPVLD
jgi:hypothetical protein